MQGGEKLQEAFYIYQELAEKNTATPLLLNGQATAYIAQGKYEEAEALLQEAIEKVRLNIGSWKDSRGFHGSRNDSEH